MQKDKDLHDAYLRMRDVFENLRSTLSCSLCYELFKPGDVTTLECGHTMCRHCLKQWNDSHLRLYNLATTPDCPECRQPGRHYVKVYLLEEVVRVVDRLERLEAEAEAMKQADRKAALENEKLSQRTASMDSSNTSNELQEDTDDEAAEISANLLGK
jgi:bifunctional apoptosis regulator